MQLCWENDPFQRPSFKKCVNMLISIKTEVRRVNLGYNIDGESDYAVYANSNGILLSSFLANSLPKAVKDVTDDKPNVFSSDNIWTELATVCKASECDNNSKSVEVKNIDDSNGFREDIDSVSDKQNIGVSRL